MRQLFLTHYYKPCDDLEGGGQVKFSSYVLANSITHAEHIVEVRNLGEFISGAGRVKPKGFRNGAVVTNIMVPPFRIYERLVARDKGNRTLGLKLLHQVMFLLELGRTSKRYMPDTPLFGDTDAIHQIVHLMDDPHVRNRKSVINLVWDLYLATPEMFITDKEEEQLYAQLIAKQQKEC